MTGLGILALVAMTLAEGLVAANDDVTGYAALQDRRFDLVAMDGAPVTAPAGIEFLDGGMIRGDGPCNGFGAAQTADWPGFAVGFIRSTKMACPDLPLEQAFFERLQSATDARFEDGTLILTDPEGRRLEFRSQPD